MCIRDRVIIVKALHSGKCGFAFHLHTAAAALHGHGNDGQTFPQLVPAQKTGMLVQLHKFIKDLAGQDHASRRDVYKRQVHIQRRLCILFQNLDTAFFQKGVERFLIHSALCSQRLGLLGRDVYKRQEL